MITTEFRKSIFMSIQNSFNRRWSERPADGALRRARHVHSFFLLVSVPIWAHSKRIGRSPRRLNYKHLTSVCPKVRAPIKIILKILILIFYLYYLLLYNHLSILVFITGTQARGHADSLTNRFKRIEINSSIPQLKPP